MPIYNREESGLVELDLEELELEEALTSLMLGDVLVIQGYEKTRGKDILIKLDDRKHKVTYISFDLDPFHPTRRFWQMHNVSLNAFSLHTVFRYDEYTYSMDYKYRPQHVVQVRGMDNHVYIIERVFVTPEKKPYYMLSGLEGYYSEEELEAYEM